MKRLGEIALFTADVDRLVEFYRNLLDAEPVFSQRGEAASFMVGDVKLFLHHKGAPAPDVPPNEDHIAFFVDDVDAESEALHTRGVAAETGPREFYWGRSAYYRDPDGRQVELHRPSRPAHMETVYTSVLEAINCGDADALDQWISPDIVDHNPIPGQAPGLDGFKQWMASARSAFPDLHGTIDEIFAVGDKVVARVRWRGRHLGTFAGVASTGREVVFSAIHIARQEGDKIVEWWGVADLLGARQQLGAL